jgi:hypothetical protein
MDVVIAFVIGMIVGSSATFVFVLLGFMAYKASEERDEPLMRQFLDQINPDKK